MGMMVRRDFSGGWNPSADSVNGPQDCLLRMDNCLLDEIGAVALRKGSAKINSSPLSDVDVRSLYTAYLSGTRYRMTQAGDSVYANGTGIDNSWDSALDTQFSSYLGQILFASGTKKQKYDGTTVRLWGLAAPTVAPTVAETASASTVFSSCASAESNGAMTSNEGVRIVTACTNATPRVVTTESAHNLISGNNVFISGSGGLFDGTWNITYISATTYSLDTSTNTGAYVSGAVYTGYVADRAATADAAMQLIADTTTFRGTSTRTLTSPVDFSAYSDTDVIEMYVKVDEPEKLTDVTLMIDFNDGTFQSDWVHYTWQASDLRPDLGSWNYVSALRSTFTEVHNTADKSWNSVKAVRVTFTGIASATLTFDQILIKGGSGAPITGNDVTYRYIYVRSDGTYQGKSGISPVSLTTVFRAQGSIVTCANPTDTQVIEIWLFRLGGTLDEYYRIATHTVTAWSGTAAIIDATSDLQALDLNIKLETDNTVPPDNIIGLSEDYYTRIFALTSNGLLHPSRRLNLDSFATGQQIRVGGVSETPYWVKKTFGGLYIGTSKDIYRLEGFGDELPDGTIDFRLRTLNINSPPINNAVASDGNVIVYIAQDGPRLFSGESSSPLRGQTDLLWRGYTRHGAGPVAVLTPGTRFSMAISDGILSCITPEGSLATASQILHRYNMAQQRWYRHLYPQEFRTLYREPDGTLIAGDSAGYVRELDTGTADDGTGISVEIWTPFSDDGKPMTRKRTQRLRVRLNSGGTAAGVAVYLEGSETQAANVNVASSGVGFTDNGIDTLSASFLIGIRITGTFTTFKLYEYAVEYLENPQLMWGRTAATNMDTVDTKVLSGIQIRACTLGISRTVSVLLDNSTVETFQLLSNTNDPASYTHQFSTTRQANEVALSLDGNVELYDWTPHVLYKLPATRRIWDSGPIDFGTDQMIWIRQVRINGIVPEDATVSIYFNGIISETQTVEDGFGGTVVSIYEVHFGREVKGRQPSIRMDAGSGNTLNIYWVEILYRGSGGETQKKRIKMVG